MSRGTWNKIKLSKFFYVKSYRVLLALSVISGVANVVLCFGVIYVALHKIPETYYATNGEMPPIKLQGLLSANNSPVALLPPDPINENDTRIIPE